MVLEKLKEETQISSGRIKANVGVVTSVMAGMNWPASRGGLTELIVLLSGMLTLSDFFFFLKSREVLLGHCFMWLVCEGIYLIERQVRHVFQARWSKVRTYYFLFAAKIKSQVLCWYSVSCLSLIKWSVCLAHINLFTVLTFQG